jgi:hypothetical protein
MKTLKIAAMLLTLAAPVKAANYALECDTILNSPPHNRP